MLPCRILPNLLGVRIVASSPLITIEATGPFQYGTNVEASR
ncbi:hypothetical protein [Xanthomonas phage vB_XooS_NR08]|nr:hypothetical protein [Xanthomonas phage vB_XooS_NR08]